MRRLILVIALALLAGGGVLGYNAWRDLQIVAVDLGAIPSFEVREGRFEVSLTSIGEVRAAESSVLASPFEGKIVKLLPEGTRVEAGEPVIWFETDQLEDELLEQEAQLKLDEKDLQGAMDAYELEKVKNNYLLEAERNAVEIARQSQEDARQKFESEKVLYERNISPQTKLDERRIALLQAELSLRNAHINLAKVEENLAANLRVKEREIEKAQLRVEQTRDRVAEAQRKVAEAVVKAPGPGDISYLKIWKSGQVSKVAEGDQVWRRSSLVEIPNTAQMLAIVPVNEIDISSVEPGQRAEVRLIAVPDRVFAGVVDTKSIVPISDASQRSWDTGGSGAQSGPREFEVRVRLLEQSDLLRQGMSATARVIIAEIERATYVPLEALFDVDGRRGVWVASGGPAEFRPVRVLLTNEDYAAVESQLAAGERVLLADPTGREAAPALPAVAEQLPVEEVAPMPVVPPGAPS